MSGPMDGQTGGRASGSGDGSMDDARLEHEVREVLRARDPGPAPYGLRERVLDVPVEARRAGADPRRVIVPLLGLAATLLLVAIGAQVLVARPVDLGAGASPIASQAPAAASFDPGLVGPGIVTSSPSGWVPFLLAAATVVLVVLGVAVRGRRRLVPLAGAVACIGFGVYASQVPIEVSTFGYGPGLNVVEASAPPGTVTPVFYETAAPGQPFSFPLFLSLRAPIPVRLEGLYEPSLGEGVIAGLRPTAVWTDGEPNGGSIGPARPFEPVETDDWVHTLWVVGRAGSCAAGVAVDPANPPTQYGYTWLESVTLQTSVLGFPRTVELQLPFRLVEFQTDTCDPHALPTPGGSASPSAAPSGG